MKKAVSTYRFAVLFALIFAMLGAVCFAPILKAQTKTVSSANKQNKETDNTNEHVLTIAHHVLSTISFSFECNSDLIPSAFEYLHFGLPFEVIHRILSASFQNSYLENIFPFAISAQAP